MMEDVDGFVDELKRKHGSPGEPEPAPPRQSQQDDQIDRQPQMNMERVLAQVQELAEIGLERVEHGGPPRVGYHDHLSDRLHCAAAT
ncbi:hypothetical protein D3C72_2235270 [compost metagenome]